MTKRARPYCPGRTRPPGFGNRNCTVSVPVVASTARSTTSSLPFCGRTVPSARMRSMGIGSPPRSLRSCSATRARRRYSASARPARKRIGSILRHRRQQRALAAADEVAGLHERGADEPIDRRGHRRIAEVEPGPVDYRARGGDLRARGVLRSDRVIELLLADGLLGGERREALDIVLRLHQPRLPGGRDPPRRVARLACSVFGSMR